MWAAILSDCNTSISEVLPYTWSTFRPKTAGGGSSHALQSGLCFWYTGGIRGRVLDSTTLFLLFALGVSPDIYIEIPVVHSVLSLTRARTPYRCLVLPVSGSLDLRLDRLIVNPRSKTIPQLRTQTLNLSEISMERVFPNIGVPHL